MPSTPCQVRRAPHPRLHSCLAAHTSVPEGTILKPRMRLHTASTGLSQALRLNSHTLGSILQCTITRWNDPAIMALNPNVQCAVLPHTCVQALEIRSLSSLPTTWNSVVSLMLDSQGPSCNRNGLVGADVGLAWRLSLNWLACRLPAVDINPVVRVDGSGSTQLLTQYLARDPAWQLGTGTQVT